MWLRERRMERGCEGRRGPRAVGARAGAVLFACVGVALTLGVVTVPAASTPLFAAPTTYETGAGPESVAIGDLNGDGRPDLATTDSAGTTLSVFFNSGDGSFGGSVDYPTGSAPEAVVIGDLNGDGKPDLVSANRGGDTVSVFLGRG